MIFPMDSTAMAFLHTHLRDHINTYFQRSLFVVEGISLRILVTVRYLVAQFCSNKNNCTTDWSLRSLMLYIRRHHFMKFLAILTALVALFKILQPNFFSYTISYFKIIINMVNTDKERREDVVRQEAELVWGYHQLQKRFMQQICKEKKLPVRKYLWLVSLSSDNVLPGAVAVAHSIKLISCYTKIGAMVTSNLSNVTRTILEQVGYEIFQVESLDCNWMEESMNVPTTNTGIPGTHTRFQAWSLVQFEKIVYVDIDYMLLTNIDEVPIIYRDLYPNYLDLSTKILPCLPTLLTKIFELPGELSAVYCARPGVLDPCFNAGLAVFRPSMETRAELIAKWKELTGIMGCVSDQVVMWYYFAFTGRWNPLPYSYNVRRKLFYPMKAYHFAGYGVTPKPWDMKPAPTKKEAFNFPGPAIQRDDMNMLWWQLFYDALDQYKLHEWWNSR